MDGNIISILLVEDDLVDVMNIKRAFSKNNIQNPVSHASNGLEALNMLRGTEGYEKINPQPQVILLDLNMPQMNGFEFLKELRNDPVLKSISVFIMTTSNDERDKMNAYNYNVAGYILKPVSFEKFVSAVSILNNYWKLCEQNEAQ